MSKKRPNAFSRGCFKVIKKIVGWVYPAYELRKVENIPEEPCVLVGNHSQLHGPLVSELHLDESCYTWCAGQMMSLKEVPAYTYKDFWSGKPKYIRWLFKIVSYLIAPLAVCIFNNARTIAVHRDNRIISTFRESVSTLKEGKNLVIFPECYDEHNNIVHEFQKNFVDVAKLYYKKAEKRLCFVPMYIAPNLKQVHFGTPIEFDPLADIETERERVCNFLMDEITTIATALPEHTVVPYPNINKNLHPKNKA